MSGKSIFKVRSVMDFLETLQVLQFYRCKTKSKSEFIFINPNFAENRPVKDDFYKQAIDITKINFLKGTKRMVPLHYIDLFNRLLRLFKRNEIKITKLEYARLRLRFCLQRSLDLMRYELDIIDHTIEEPEYAVNKEIVGYYGDVPLSVLKQAFGNYFPIYESEEERILSERQSIIEDQQPIIEDQQPIMEDQQPIIKDQQLPVNLQINEEVMVDVESVPVVRKRHQKTPTKHAKRVADQTVPNVATKVGEANESEPPKKKRRRNRIPTLTTQKVTMKETNDALMNLQKEFDNLESAN